jgi:hypothetical protein
LKLTTAITSYDTKEINIKCPILNKSIPYMIAVVLSVDVRIFKIDVNFFNIIVVMRNFG